MRQRAEEFLRTYEVGSIVNWPGFTSTTRARRKAYVGNVLFRIESINGRSLQGYGADDMDEEVLFAAGTRYKVIDVVADGAVLAVDLVEVAERKP
jgi:hypothetical protein